MLSAVVPVYLTSCPRHKPCSLHFTLPFLSIPPDYLYSDHFVSPSLHLSCIIFQDCYSQPQPDRLFSLTSSTTLHLLPIPISVSKSILLKHGRPCYCFVQYQCNDSLFLSNNLQHHSNTLWSLTYYHQPTHPLSYSHAVCYFLNTAPSLLLLPQPEMVQLQIPTWIMPTSSFSFCPNVSFSMKEMHHNSTILTLLCALMIDKI